MNVEKQDPAKKNTASVSSLTRLIHESAKQEKEKSALSVELKDDESMVVLPQDAEVVAMDEQILVSAIPVLKDQSEKIAKFPIKTPSSPIEERMRSSSNLSFMSSESMSASIPYSVPGGSHKTASPLSNSVNSGSYSHIPNLINGQPIQSNHFSSPSVSSSNIEPRFIVSKQRVAQHHAASLSTSQSRSASHSNLSYLFNKKTPRTASSTDLGTFYNNAQNETAPAPIPHSPSTSVHLDPSRSSLGGTNSRHSSMANLKRFFNKKGGPSPVQPSLLSSSLRSNSSGANVSNMSSSLTNESSHTSNPSSPSVSNSFQPGSSNSRSSSTVKMNFERDRSNTVSSIVSNAQLPFSMRYSKAGEALGAGAGGSVKLVTRLSDKRVVAVKEFRNKYQHESKRDYAKKITGEYCIGSTLKHPNVIETVEICYENDRLLQVMEYCDYDLFAIVMSNKMSPEETNCCFKQIISGIHYIHSMGLAHRDLKLDNCVVDKSGVVKIIDFGSAVVFSYPFSKTLIEAQGIVGSDPYLAPEVCVFNKYDPRPVDVWSAAIIYCCMMLKKFPWKVPKVIDQSFRLFATRGTKALNDLLTEVPEAPKYRAMGGSEEGGLSNFKDMTKSVIDMTASDSDSDATPPPSGVPSVKQVSPTAKISPTAKVSPAKVETPPQPDAPAEGEAQGPDGKSHTSSLTGAQRLLHALPAECRPLIGRMVELAPAKRISIDEAFKDKWLTSVEMCTVEDRNDDHGVVQHVFMQSSNHKHTQVDQSEAHIAALEKKKGKK